MDELETLRRRQLAMELPGRYAYAIHALDADELGAYFTVDATMRQAWGEWTGRDAVVESYRDRFATFRSATHFLTNGHVESLDGDRAVVRSYTLALLRMTAHAPEQTTMLDGEYTFSLRWEGDTWLIEGLVIERHAVYDVELRESGFAPPPADDE